MIHKQINWIMAVLLGLLLATGVTGCSDWTETEADQIDVPGHPEAYYKQLRAYKNSSHERAFGWFGGWIGQGARLSNSLCGLPDSLDMVSLWGGWGNLNDAKKEDLRTVQRQKGTKVVFTIILKDVGEGCTPAEFASKEDKAAFWGYEAGNDEAIQAACEKYANAICDSLFKYDYDGFDLDFEPGYGNRGNLCMKDSEDPKPMLWFVNALSKRIGRLSGTGKLLIIDGESWSSPAELAPCYDFIIEQAYNCKKYTDLDDRFTRYIKHFREHRDVRELAEMYIVTENFEAYRGAGGVTHTTRDGQKVNSLKGMALWKPMLDGEEVQKGGAGVYRIEYEYEQYHIVGTYPYTRESIRCMNPSIN